VDCREHDGRTPAHFRIAEDGAKALEDAIAIDASATTLIEMIMVIASQALLQIGLRGL
jgi:hypothetical protein